MAGAAVMPANAPPSFPGQRRVVTKEHQGTEFGDSDECLLSVKSLLIIAPGRPQEQECSNEVLLLNAST